MRLLNLISASCQVRSPASLEGEIRESSKKKQYVPTSVEVTLVDAPLTDKCTHGRGARRRNVGAGAKQREATRRSIVTPDDTRHE